MQTHQPQSKGFTLIELLVVISIIGMLSSIILASLNTSREKAKISAAIQFDSSIYQARGDMLIADLPLDGSLINQAGSTQGVLVGTATYPDGSPYGKKSIQFTGSNHVVVGLNISETSFMVTFWFKASTGGGVFVARKSTEPGSNDRSITLNSSICSYIYDPTENPCYSAANFMDNKWHHFVMTYGGRTGGQEVYIDGKRIIKGTSARSGFYWQDEVHIGEGFTGQISNVKIYDTSLGG